MNRHSTSTVCSGPETPDETTKRLDTFEFYKQCSILKQYGGETVRDYEENWVLQAQRLWPSCDPGETLLAILKKGKSF